jgi:hypothetical protein
MSSDDQLRPFHAKDEARGQEAADAVAAVLKHAKERDDAANEKTAPKPQPKWLLPLGINLAAFAVYLLAWGPDWVVINPIQPPPVEVQLRNQRAGVLMAANKIESFRAMQDRLPSSLDEAGISGSGLEYSLSGQNNYSLVLLVGDEAISFNSATDSLATWGEQNAGDLSERLGG